MKKTIGGLAMLACLACTDSSAAFRTLAAAGYTDVRTTGWAPFSCSDSDTTSTGFKAKNPRGEEVTGVVCCGLVVKACTVRH